MNQAAPPSAAPVDFEIDHEDEYGRFLIGNQLEILFFLHALIRRGNLVTAYIDSGSTFFLTSILGIDESANTLLLDAAGSEEVNRQAGNAQRITLVTSHDRVRMQIRIGATRMVIHQGHPALLAELPERVLRLQRREFFRLEPPLNAPLYCRLLAEDPDNRPKTFELTLADISGGGISLIAPTGDIDYFPRDTLLKDCRLEITDEGVVIANLRVRKVIELSTQSGLHSLRIGCEFVNLRGTYLAMIQRYITRIERERKAHLPDQPG